MNAVDIQALAAILDKHMTYFIGLDVESKYI